MSGRVERSARPLTGTWPEMDATGGLVTESDVRALEDTLGTTLPDDYRAFLLAVNGGKPAPSHRVLPLAREPVVLRDLHSLSDSGAPFDLATRIARFRGRVPYPLVPIGTAAGAMRSGLICLCLEGSHRGSVWYIAVPGPEPTATRRDWHERDDLTRVADAFLGFLDQLRSLSS